MHPELLGALARDRTRALDRDIDRHFDRRRRRGDRARPRITVARARWHVGAALIDVGLHLMSRASGPPTSVAEPAPTARRAA